MGIDPVSLAIASAIIGGGSAALGQVMQGRERSMAQRFDSEQKQREAEMYRLSGAQAETKRREHLTSSIETIMAIRSGRGVGEASPTGMGSINEIIEDESRDMRTERINYLTREEQANLASRMAMRQARGSLLAGYLGGVSEVASTGFRIGSLRMPRP